MSQDLLRQTDDAPALLTVAEVAAALRVSDETIRRRIGDGTIAGLRLGSVLRVPARELERVLEDATNTTRRNA
jgi:excisionase family DNA binding protein